ncbi:HNH endonuclease [Nocardia terpenica]|uniref:HNH endonuclease n=1 Tax=Nocardia terpenica TaxID=455432 RepID=UPI00031FB5F0|nr:HNH endonuclease [Nocardia terpenica]NQE88757.1 HNH endonuclease [Nocardia terpenica]
MTVASDPRQTYRWRVLVADLRKQRLPCWVCGQPIDYTAKRFDPDGFEADHVYPVSTHPHLAFEPANVRPSHVRCNRSRGNGEPAPAGAWVRSEF